MFTGNTLPLGKFHQQFGLDVQRDCEFSFVGKVPTNLERRIVPCARPAHIDDALGTSGIAGIVTSEKLAPLVPRSLGLAISEFPMHSALELQSHISMIDGFQWESFETRIHPSVNVGKGAIIAERDVLIGENTVIHPGAIILPRSVIGIACSIGPGAVVAADAFDIDTHDDPPRVVRQSGGVRIADNVDIQAKCTLVRATFGGFTELGEGTKFDCQVHFAHDSITGRNVRVAACAEISGRVTIGEGVFIGPNASVSNGITINSGAHVTIGSVVTRDVPAGETVTGNFAVSHRKWLSFMRSLK